MSVLAAWEVGLLVGALMGGALGYSIAMYRHYRFLADGFQYLSDITIGSRISSDDPVASAVEISRAFGSRRSERAS